MNRFKTKNEAIQDIKERMAKHDRPMYDDRGFWYNKYINGFDNTLIISEYDREGFC